MSEPVLRQPDQTKPFKVEVDVSNYTMGAVLMQRDEKNVLHPIASFSKSMNEAQNNYNIYNKELLGLQEMLRHWRIRFGYTPIMPTYCSGRTPENIIEEWHDGMLS